MSYALCSSPRGNRLTNVSLSRLAWTLLSYRKIGRESNCKSLIWVDSIDSSDCALRELTNYYLHEPLTIASKYYAIYQIREVPANILLQYHRLPLSLLTTQELIEDSNPLLKGRHLCLQRRLHLGTVLTELDIKVLPVRSSRHGGAEDGLDDERVVGLEGVAVGLAEGVSKLLAGVVEVVTEGLGGEVKATVKDPGC